MNKEKGDITMKKSEILNQYQTEIIDAMVHYHDVVVDSLGRVQYKLYIWSDGEIEAMEQAQGETGSYLVPLDGETRELYYITTVTEGPGFDPWDVLYESKPDDPAEQEAKLEEILSWLKEHYRNDAELELETLIYWTEQEEKYA